MGYPQPIVSRNEACLQSLAADLADTAVQIAPELDYSRGSVWFELRHRLIEKAPALYREIEELTPRQRARVVAEALNTLDRLNLSPPPVSVAEPNNRFTWLLLGLAAAYFAGHAILAALGVRL